MLRADVLEDAVVVALTDRGLLGDVGLYLIVVAYVMVMWYIEAHVIPDSGGDEVDA